MGSTSSCYHLLSIGLLGLSLVLGISASPAESRICVSTYKSVSAANGLVVDSEGAPVPGVTVSLSRLRRSEPWEVGTLSTDEDGSFAFGRLFPGTYEITTSIEGFLNTVETFAITDHAPRDALLRVKLSFLVGECPEVDVISRHEAKKIQRAHNKK